MKEETYGLIQSRSNEVKKGNFVSEKLTGKYRREVIELACEAIRIEETIKQINIDMYELEKDQVDKKKVLQEKQKQQIERQETQQQQLRAKQQAQLSLIDSNTKDQSGADQHQVGKNGEDFQNKLKSLEVAHSKLVQLQEVALNQFDTECEMDKKVLSDKKDELEETLFSIEEQITAQFDVFGLRRYPESKQQSTGIRDQRWLLSSEEDINTLKNQQYYRDIDDNDVGFVRNEVSDTRWEDRIDLDINNTQNNFDQIPSVLKPSLVLPVFISLILILSMSVANIIVVGIYIFEFQNFSSSMILAGFLPSVSGQIQYFTLRLVLNFTEIEIPGDPIVFQGISNPIWNDSSHLSSNRTHILKLLQRSGEFYRTLSASTHFGRQKTNNRNLNDHRLSVIESDRLQKDINIEILMKKRSQQLHHISLVYQNYITENTSYIRFLASALREDVKNGLDQLLQSLLEEIQDRVKESKQSIIIIENCFAFTIFIVFVLNGLRWIGQMQKTSKYSRSLIRLLHVSNDEQEQIQLQMGKEGNEHQIEFEKRDPLTLLDAMKTYYPPYDSGRQLIFDQARTTIDAVNEFEFSKEKSFVNILSSIKHLMKITLKQFEWEEREMLTRVNLSEYEVKKKMQIIGPNGMDDMNEFGVVKITDHKQQHLLIRQRLTHIFDILFESSKLNGKQNYQFEKGKDSFLSKVWRKIRVNVFGASDNSYVCAVNSMIRRQITQLFDSHFMELDNEFATLKIPESEKEGTMKQE
ncbi:MAG: hypothetical protein EZS28_018614 [Streblomastix strix]|uniref:Uncharacterized protein n=1 Tax=Streblomastix strix TaxID=222440 RepID=A0A5J4VTG0_9EUKA|nr:MAG: hypothetical protein EZS28_018614 [Streblomastix strix]